MGKIQNVFSLRELHDLLEQIEDKTKTMVWFDFDLCLVQPHHADDEKDVLIEPQTTKKLFKYMMEHGINFAIVTARFYDTACNHKKRNLTDIKENIETSIFPILEELGIDITAYKDRNLDDQLHLIKNEKGKTVALLYKGIIFSGIKGQAIKHYRRQFDWDKKHTTNIFIDDIDTYLNSVSKHVPEAIVLRRHISSPLI